MNNRFCFKILFFVLTAAIFCILFLFDGCRSKTKNYEPVYQADSGSKKVLLLGLPTQPYYEITAPLVRYLNQHLKNVQVRPVATFTLNEYIQKLDQKYFDFTLANGQLALESEKNGYSIIGKVSDDNSYRGVILVNKDSAINSFADLKNKTVASPGDSAVAGHMMPMLYLYKNGVNVKTDIRLLNSNSFESAILNVYLGKCSAAFSWITNWNSFLKRRPEITSKVALKWETPALINTAILFRNDMDKETAAELKSLLFSLDKSDEGRKVLDPIGFTGFQFADSNTYLPVKQFLAEYNSVLH